MLVVASRSPWFITSAAVVPVSRSPSFGPIRSYSVVSGSLGETFESAAVIIVRGQAGHACKNLFRKRQSAIEIHSKPMLILIVHGYNVNCWI